MSDLEPFKKAWENYKNSPKTEDLKQKTLELAKKMPSNMWTVFFSSDRDMSNRFLMLEIEQTAQEAKNNYLSSPSSPLLRMTASLAYTNCQSHSDNNYGEVLPERVEVWNKVFADVPKFKETLENELKHWDNWRKETTSKYSPTKELKENKEVVEVITIMVPFRFLDETGEQVEQYPEELIQEVVDHYNQFRLDTYMKLPFSTSDTKLKAQEDMWHFSFYITESIPEEKKNKYLTTLEEQLSGQLSDGWGESIEQRGMLVENKVIYPGFDTNNIKIMQNSPPTKKLKNN